MYDASILAAGSSFLINVLLALRWRLQGFRARSVYFDWTIDVPLQWCSKKERRTIKSKRESRAKQKYQATMNELMNGWVFKTEWHEQQQKQREEKKAKTWVFIVFNARTPTTKRETRRDRNGTSFPLHDRRHHLLFLSLVMVVVSSDYRLTPWSSPTFLFMN